MKGEPVGLTLENDGEVRVFLPIKLRPRLSPFFKSYGHAQTQRRVGITPQEFREKYGVGMLPPKSTVGCSIPDSDSRFRSRNRIQKTHVMSHFPF
jgi:hypothetical protein